MCECVFVWLCVFIYICVYVCVCVCVCVCVSLCVFMCVCVLCLFVCFCMCVSLKNYYFWQKNNHLELWIRKRKWINGILDWIFVFKDSLKRMKNMLPMKCYWKHNHQVQFFLIWFHINFPPSTLLICLLFVEFVQTSFHCTCGAFCILLLHLTFH